MGAAMGEGSLGGSLGVFFLLEPPRSCWVFPRKGDHTSISPVYRHGCVYIGQIWLGFGLNSVENGQIAFFFF